MKYLAHMQEIDDGLMQKVLNLRQNYDPNAYNEADVLRAIEKKNRNLDDFGALLSVVGAKFLEELARASMSETRAKFGNNISLFTPIYISNYCDNNCVYCGFSKKNQIKRAKLSDDELIAE